MADVERKQEDEPVNLPELEGHTAPEVYQHVRRCQERGYLKLAHIQPVDNRPGNRHTGMLTWEGHNALDEGCETRTMRRGLREAAPPQGDGHGGE